MFQRLRTTSLLQERRGLGGVNVDPDYFTIILQSSVGTLEGHSESVCIGRNRCATYTNHVITIRNHICKLAGCGAKGPTLVVAGYFGSRYAVSSARCKPPT